MLPALRLPFLALGAPADHLLFVNKSHSLVELDPRLQLRMQPAHKEGRVIWPTEPWESWAVFGYNHVVAGDEASGRPHRMYYDCIEGAGVPPGEASAEDSISHRRICLAESTDGLVWTKPELGLFNRSGSARNNILLEDSGVSVFLDGKPGTPADAAWKMVCSNAAYASHDGLLWRRLPFVPVAPDDTKPTAYYDPALGKYVVSVRRDLPPFARTIGRCVTANISDWQEEVPGHGGCAVVFGVDEKDPQPLDVYTNAWTPYPSIEAPLLHLFFPSMYHHFGSAPFGLGNDGLLDVRRKGARTPDQQMHSCLPYRRLTIRERCGWSSASTGRRLATRTRRMRGRPLSAWESRRAAAAPTRPACRAAGARPTRPTSRTRASTPAPPTWLRATCRAPTAPRSTSTPPDSP